MDILKKLRARNRINYDARPLTTFEGYPIIALISFPNINPPDKEDLILALLTDYSNIITSQVSSKDESWLEDIVFYD